tara:strand:- start:2089 stop:2367 length:279 start_codon:yes stop_codon:yes gene_type:complete
MVEHGEHEAFLELLKSDEEYTDKYVGYMVPRKYEEGVAIFCMRCSTKTGLVDVRVSSDKDTVAPVTYKHAFLRGLSCDLCHTRLTPPMEVEP